MSEVQTIKEELLREIEQLSNPYLIELQNFIRYLTFKQTGRMTLSSSSFFLPSDKDPILGLIGIVDITPFSDEVDNILYGTI